MKVLQFKNKDKKGVLRNVGKMEIKNKTDSQADLYMYGDIVSSEWGKWKDTDTCPEDVKNFLDEVIDLEDLNIYINSGGGSVFAGMAIYNMLNRSKANITVYVDGLAGSIASVIAMVADKLVIPSNAYLMIHKAWTFTYGNSSELRDTADTLDKIDEGILNVYEQKLKGDIDIETIKSMIEKETWLTGKDAGEYFDIVVDEDNQAVACCSDYFDGYNNIPNEIIGSKPAVPKEKPKVESNKNNKDEELAKAKAKLYLELL